MNSFKPFWWFYPISFSTGLAMTLLVAEGATASSRCTDARCVSPSMEQAIVYFDDNTDPKNAVDFLKRGNEWQKKKEYDKSIKDFDEAIRLDPKLALAYVSRGNAWQMKQDFDKAIKDYDEAIRLDPKFALTYVGRGMSWYYKKDYDKAIKDFGQAIGLDSKDVYAYYRRAIACQHKGDYDKAIQDYDQVIRLDGNYSGGLNDLAWLLATCPEAKFRDGKRAIELATKVCDLTAWKEPAWFDTLAAAYAEGGQFEEAAKWQEKFLQSAKIPKAEVEGAKERLQLYRDMKPYREK
jgi:tetratricopeptide (TPR) repeat protein